MLQTAQEKSLLPKFPISIHGNDLDETRAPVRYKWNKNYILVQTRELMCLKSRLGLSNLWVDEFLGNNTFLCRYEDNDLDVIRAYEFVVWVDAYHKYFKVDSDLKIEAAKHAGDIQVSLTFHDETKLDENLRIRILEMTGVDDREIEIQFSDQTAYLTVPSTCLDDLAAIDEIFRIQRLRETESQNDEPYLIMEDGTKVVGRITEPSGGTLTIFDFENM
ncbi:hypothetical protein J3E69DRAFT_367094 [Trichoderma sp. SZMC 28015]